MKKWLVLVLCSFLVNFSFSQEVAVAKLRNETSRSIKKRLTQVSGIGKGVACIILIYPKVH